jgi:hypothetical protein
MFSPESKLYQQPGQLKMPALPGLQATEVGANSNPFSGIHRAGSAKRSQDLAKFQGKAGAVSPPSAAPNASFDGSKYQAMGGQAKTQFGSMRQMKF